MIEINKQQSDHIPISQIPQIQEPRGVIIEERSELAQYVEGPLLSACEILFDKKIITVSTSANSDNIGSGAYIIIDFDALSQANKEIGLSMGGEMYFSEADGGNQLKIILPLTERSTFADVQKAAEAFAHAFLQQ